MSTPGNVVVCDCIACDPSGSVESATIAAIAACRHFGLAEVLEDLCPRHRDLLERATRAAIEATS